MKPPEEVFPKQKSVEFDYNGRPFHPFFFTNKPQYTQIMYELAEHIGNIIAFSDRMRSLKVSPNPEEVLGKYLLSILKYYHLGACTYRNRAITGRPPKFSR